MNDPEQYNLKENPDHEQLKNTIPIKQSQFEARAKQYFNEAKPLTDTAAQSYLKQQGIDISQHDNLRYHQAVFSSETRQTYPALIANITNDKNETKAVEITYLDKDTNSKAALKIPKRIIGSKSGNSTVINKGSNTDYSIVVVGIENALSINTDNKNNADIIALNNNNDAKSFKPTELRGNVIVVLDTNNTKETGKLAEDITTKLESSGKHVTVIEPNIIMDGLDKTETTKQMVNEAVDNITTKSRYLSSAIKSLNSDIINNLKPDNTNDKPEHSQHINKANDHYQQLAIDNQRESTKEISTDRDLPEFNIGEKTM